MYHPQQPMTTKYYLISSKYPSDNELQSHRPDWLLKIGTSLKCFVNFSCVPKGAVLRICRMEYGIWAKPKHMASVVSDHCKVDIQRWFAIFLNWFWVAGVLFVPLATHSKTKTSSFSNSTQQRSGCNSHKISSNMGVGQSDIGKYHTK